MAENKVKGQKIAVIGSTNTDMVVVTDTLPRPGETLLGGKFFMNAGGKGANQAVAAARLGGNVSFVAKTGNDVFGRQAKELFSKEGINTRAVCTDEESASGVALINVDKHGENCIAVAPGANDKLTPNDIQSAEKQILESEIVLLQLEIPLVTVEYAINLAFRGGSKVVLNPAPARQLPDHLYKKLYLITPNETEAEVLTGVHVTDEPSAQKAAEILVSKGTRHVIITLGSKGAYIYSNGEGNSIPAPKVNAIDTTAAGDVFNGALCVALAENMPLAEAVRFAIKAASISVTRMGAQASAPFREEVRET
ncbi:MAG TPA: ribokinase [Bacteroidales bacterium]|nr:ribokinase [Bacteroidales bacterium]